MLRGLLRGETYKSIAYIIGCTEATVKNHANSLFRQLNVSGRAELQAEFVNREDLAAIDNRIP